MVDAADPVLPESGKQLENSGRTLNQNKHLAVEYKLVFMLEMKFSMYHDIVQFDSRLFRVL